MYRLMLCVARESKADLDYIKRNLSSYVNQKISTCIGNFKEVNDVLHAAKSYKSRLTSVGKSVIAEIFYTEKDGKVLKISNI